jgi:hypothetical protein
MTTIIPIRECLTITHTTGIYNKYISYLPTYAAESALRRSRLEAELAASRVATEAILSRSRI